MLQTISKYLSKIHWKWFIFFKSKLFPKMTLLEFESANLPNKTRLVVHYGEYIEEFYYNDTIVSLYSLNLFFVEVITTNDFPTKVLEINGFNDGAKLNMYTLSRSLNS